MALTTTEIETEIAEITVALSHITKGGQEYEIGTGPSRRNVTMADYDTLFKRRSDLCAMLAEENGNSGITLTAGW